VEGPVFDEIARSIGATQVRVSLSPSGGHSAYVGRRGGDFIAVVDGKEAGPVYTAATSNLGTGYASAGWAFFFNQDGSHLAYAVLNDTGSWSMMVDGVKGDRFAALDLKQVLLNGKRIVYTAQTADQKWHLVVDGKTGPAYDQIQSLMMTADGVHYAFIGSKGRDKMVVLDSVDQKSYPAVSDLEMAPDGRIAYQAMVSLTATGPGGNPPHLMVAGLDIPHTSPFSHPTYAGSTPLHHVAFSPDGKRVAYIQRNAASSNVSVMVNGKPMGLEYANASDLMFSPDGSRFAYVGTSATTGSFVVVDGKELAGYHAITDLQFSSDGKRYAFRGYLPSAPPGATGVWAVIEGQEPKKYGDVAIWSMTFSSGGKHVAYSAQAAALNYQAVIDGDVRPGYLGNFASVNSVQPPINFPIFVYSPDGNRLAFVGPSKNGSGKASVILDGTAYEGISSTFSFPSYSSTSKHFAWIQNTGKGYVPTVDGKIGPSYETMLELSVAGCRFVDDHTFRFYGVKGGQIFRVTLDLGN